MSSKKAAPQGQTRKVRRKAVKRSGVRRDGGSAKGVTDPTGMTLPSIDSYARDRPVKKPASRAATTEASAKGVTALLARPCP